MSLGKFGDEGKSRVARVANPASSQLLESLKHKRENLAKISAAVSSKKPIIFPAKNDPFAKLSYGGTTKGGRKKKAASDEDEDDFIVDDEESEEEEEDFHLSDEDEPPPKKRKPKPPVTKPVNKAPVLMIKVSQTETITAKGKERTLSESSDEEEWLCKPSLVGAKQVMKTQPLVKKVQRKAIILSDESSSDDDKPNKSISTLKNVAKSAAKHKKKNGGSGSDDDEADDGEGDMSDRAGDTPSDDSDAEERKSRRRREKEDDVMRTAREFFNAASHKELMATPRFNDRLAACIIGNRPFETFADLEDAITEVARGKAALETYIEHLENRDILAKILDDCKDHSDAVAADFEKCTTDRTQPSLLTSGCCLHEYQQIGLNWLIMMYEKGFNCILGDEMGLGKTIQVIAFMAYLKEKKIRGPHLIVVPSSTVENWMGELTKWCPDISLLTYYGGQDERKQLRHMAKKKKQTIDVVLTTYNMISSKHDDKKFFKNFSMNYVVYDEGHMLKNCATDRYKNLMKVKGQRKILLTGTPLQNNLIELISLMYFVMTPIFTKYCEDITQLLQHFKQNGPAMEIDSSNVMYEKDRIEQAKLILQPYILRRLKVQVLGHLPPKTEKIIEVEMTQDQKELYESVVDSIRGVDGDPNNSYGALVRLRQAANHPLLRRVHYDERKIEKVARLLVAKEKAYEKKLVEHVAEDLSYMSDFALHQLCEKHRSTRKLLLDERLALESGKCLQLDEILPEIKKKGDKVLIFSQFTTMLDILQVYLNIRGHSFKRLDGSTPVMERQEMINEFNVDSDLFVFLLSTRAGGLGINLTSANHIILHDIDFNPYNDKQAEDRCHRMGQKKPVYVTRLISKATVEVGMHTLARKKLQLEKAVTGGVKGQLEEEGEDTRDSSEYREDKVDSNTIQTLLTSAIKHDNMHNV